MGQNRAGPKLARIFQAKILVAQPTLKTGLVGPNSLLKAKKIRAGRVGSGYTGPGHIGSGQIWPNFFQANNLMAEPGPNSGWTRVAHRVGPILPPLCGMNTCRTTKHLVDLYQAFIKGKGNQIETNFINVQGTMDHDDPYQVSLQEANNQIDDNFIDNDGAIPLTHFNISDFFEDPSIKIVHLIGDGNVYYD